VQSHRAPPSLSSHGIVPRAKGTSSSPVHAIPTPTTEPSPRSLHDLVPLVLHAQYAYARADTLPQPHFYGPVAVPPTDEPPPVLAPYSRTPCTPLAPGAGDTPEACLGSPWARCAWIIPVRGSPNWTGCTPAALDDDEVTNAPSTYAATGPTRPASTSRAVSLSSIRWTEREVVAFWDFLRLVRDGGLLGPLSIAFCAVRPTAVFSPSASTVSARELDCVDYIKVYQDAEAALLVRNALDLWGCTDSKAAASATAGTQKVRKRRVLKGARLALVDELGAGLLVC
jgi:hypothetical protein